MSTQSVSPIHFLKEIDQVTLTRISDLRPFLKNINCKFIVLQKEDDGNVIKDGGILYTFKVADQSGSVILTLWNEKGGCVRAGDILLITGGFVLMFKGTIRLACKLGTIVRLGSFNMQFSEKPFVSGDQWQSDASTGQLFKISSSTKLMKKHKSA